MQIKALHTEMATLAMQSLLTTYASPDESVLRKHTARGIAASAIVMADAMIEALLEREAEMNAPDIDDDEVAEILKGKDNG